VRAAIMVEEDRREMSRWSCNNAIAMERRHILDGEKRVARQEALMSELVEKEHTQLVPMATDVLDILRQCLEMSKTRLRDLEGHLGEPPYHN
jgi:hypothetical protein